MNIYEKLKQARLACGLTQAQLSEALGYKTVSFVRAVESGKKTLTEEQLAVYAAALQTTVEDLHTEDTPAEEAEKQAVPVEEPVSATVTIIEKKNRRPFAWLPFVNLGLCFLLAVCMGVSSYFLYLLSEKIKARDPAVILQSITPSHDYTSNSDGTLDTAALLQEVLPSVVCIQTDVSLGSGVILTENGWILTCAHVINGATTVKVMTNDGKVYQATAFVGDENSDVGVVKIEGSFQPAKVGDSSKVVAGERIIAVGTPISAEFFQTATQGIVSALRPGMHFAQLNLMMNVIQHDAAINGGNSGGPLFNSHGELIGINSIKMASSKGFENLCFAIVSNDAVRFATDLIQYGKVNRPMIGIMGSSVAGTMGVTVGEVLPGTPAERAGLRVGDKILRADDVELSGITHLIFYLTQQDFGATVELTVLRDGETIKIPLTVVPAIEID